jgi:hypothetical protein
MVRYEMEEVLAKALADFEFRACEHLPVLRENGVGDVTG